MSGKRTIHRRRARNRGSAYLLILGASLLVLVIGVSGLIASRLTHRIARNESDTAAARSLALAAIDRGLLVVKESGSGWRAALSTANIAGVTLDHGQYTLTVSDPLDGDVTDSPSDPVVLRGTGEIGETRQMLQVTLSASGKPMAGSWKQVVD